MGSIRSAQPAVAGAEHRQDACELAVVSLGTALQQGLPKGNWQQSKTLPTSFRCDWRPPALLP